MRVISELELPCKLQWMSQVLSYGSKKKKKAKDTIMAVTRPLVEPLAH